MGSTFDRELIAYLRTYECRFVRDGKGSHQIWYSPITQKTFTVPNNVVSRHTANAVLKQAGIGKKFN